MSRKKPSGPGTVVIARQVLAGSLDEGKARSVVLLLAGSVALMMTGAGIIMPVFARRLSELGDGVQALGLMTMAFALAQMLAAPLMGSLADRYGRRPLVLLGLLAFAFTNVTYLFLQTTASIILVRALGGLFTAGIFPAAIGAVADVFPENRRARWVGIIMGGYGVGFIFGPVLGGFLYDGWGYIAPFAFSAAAGGLALLAAWWQVPETRPLAVRRREALRQQRLSRIHAEPPAGLLASLPRPLIIFITLLGIDFVGSFAFAFIEPQMIFYMYDELGWSTSAFGIVVGVYGLAMVLGQLGLGNLSDRIGRKPVIVLGQILSVALYAGIVLTTDFSLILVISLVAGLGAALTAPALSAFFLDITPEKNRSQVVGIKGSALALGGVVGPLLVALATRFLDSAGIFTLAGALVLLSALLAAILLKEPQHLKAAFTDSNWQVSSQRNLAAQSAMRGIVMQAQTARGSLPAQRWLETWQSARARLSRRSGKDSR